MPSAAVSAVFVVANLALMTAVTGAAIELAVLGISVFMLAHSARGLNRPI